MWLSAPAQESSKQLDGYSRKLLNTKEQESGAPKGTISELLCQAQDIDFIGVWPSLHFSLAFLCLPCYTRFVPLTIKDLAILGVAAVGGAFPGGPAGQGAIVP